MCRITQRFLVGNVSKLSRHVGENGIRVSIGTPIPVPYNHPYRVIFRRLVWRPLCAVGRTLRRWLLLPGGDV